MRVRSITRRIAGVAVAAVALGASAAGDASAIGPVGVGTDPAAPGACALKAAPPMLDTSDTRYVLGMATLTCGPYAYASATVCVEAVLLSSSRGCASGSVGPNGRIVLRARTLCVAGVPYVTQATGYMYAGSRRDTMSDTGGANVFGCNVS